MRHARLFFYFSVLALAGCADLAPRTLTEKPGPLMDADQARQILTDYTKNPPTLHDGYYVSSLDGLRILQEKIEFYYRVYSKDPALTYTCTFRSIDATTVKDYGVLSAPYRYGFRFGQNCDMTMYFKTPELAENLLHALQRLRQDSTADELPPLKGDALKPYSPSPANTDLVRKSDLSEVARQYQIQAKLAVDEHRDEDAIELYAKGLHLDPSWKEGHLDRAVLLSQHQRYAEAILEMNEYIALLLAETDSAQNKISQWKKQEQPASH